MHEPYMVNSEHVRGERRTYWVVDLRDISSRSRGSGGEPVNGSVTTDRRKAQRFVRSVK
jgi:hypothetical protein